jgi:hypothetical protein
MINMIEVIYSALFYASGTARGCDQPVTDLINTQHLSDISLRAFGQISHASVPLCQSEAASATICHDFGAEKAPKTTLQL